MELRKATVQKEETEEWIDLTKEEYEAFKAVIQAHIVGSELPKRFNLVDSAGRYICSYYIRVEGLKPEEWEERQRKETVREIWLNNASNLTIQPDNHYPLYPRCDCNPANWTILTGLEQHVLRYHRDRFVIRSGKA